MEKAESEEEFFEFILLFAIIEHIIVEGCVASSEISSQSLRGFKGHFDSILEDRDRELISGHRSAPESEVLMKIFVEIFHYSL
jgi:hypothetical protein